MIKIYQQYCMRTKIRPQGKRENKQALRIRVRTVHTVNVSSRNALHVGTNSTPLLLFFYTCAKFTSIIKIFIVEIAKSTAL